MKKLQDTPKKEPVMKEIAVVREKESDPFAQFGKLKPARYLSQPFTRSMIKTETRRRAFEQMTDSSVRIGPGFYNPSEPNKQ